MQLIPILIVFLTITESKVCGLWSPTGNNIA